MAAVEQRAPLQPGERAPDFALPAVDREGLVSLADYRGKRAVLLAIERGVWCAFCRRHLAHLDLTREKLRPVDVETLAIVATDLERARLYFRYHPTSVPLAADPELSTHRSYGLREMPMTPLTLVRVLTTRVNPTGELPKPMPLLKVGGVLDRMDNFEATETDRDDKRRQGRQLVGQFLIDRDGIVRWRNIEGAQEGPAGIGRFPSDDELLAVVRGLPS
jgi:peroxiredoxin